MKLIKILLLLLISINSYAGDYGKDIDKLFIEIVKGNYTESLATALHKSYSHMQEGVTYEQAKEGVGTIANTLNEVEKESGKPRGYELVTETKFGSKFAKLRYLIYFDQGPIELTLTVYAPNDVWLIKNIGIDTQIDDKFDAYADEQF